MRISPFAKTVVAIVGVVAGLAVKSVSDDTITTSELVDIGIAVLAALGVYVIPNRPDPGQ